MKILIHCCLLLFVCFFFACSSDSEWIDMDIPEPQGLSQRSLESDCHFNAPVNCYNAVEMMYEFLNGGLMDCLEEEGLIQPECNDCQYEDQKVFDVPFNVLPDGSLEAPDAMIANILERIKIFTEGLGAEKLCFVNTQIIEFFANCNEGGPGGFYIAIRYYVCKDEEGPCGAEGINEIEPCYEFLSEILPQYIDEELASCFVSRECPRGYSCEPISRISPIIYIPVAFEEDGVNTHTMINAIHDEIEALQGEYSLCFLRISATLKPFNNCYDKGAYIYLRFYYSRCVPDRKWQ